MMRRKRLFYMLTLSTALLLVACTLNAQPSTPIYVIVTSADMPSMPSPMPASPTEPPTPTIPPTPTMPPDQALTLADRYQLNGYYENAVNTYQIIILQGDSAPAEIRAAAALGLAKAALREGLFADAVNATTLFVSQFPQDARIAQAHFMRGDAYLGLSRWSEAIADFQLYLSLKPGLLDSYIHERIGDAQLALGQTDAALTSYTQAANISRTLPAQLALRERVAQADIAQGRVNDAIAQYDAILDVARNAPYRATIEYTAAQALLNSGDTETGFARMQRVLENYPDRPEAYNALQALIANGQIVDALVRARISFQHGDYQDVIDTINTYTTTHTLDAVPAEMHLLLGRAYREIGSFDAGVIAFQTIIDQYPRDPAFGEALLEQGRTKFLANDIPGAIEHYLKIADNYGYVPEAAEALWRAGYLYGTNDNPAAAVEVFERLAEAYPNTEQARSGLFLGASAAVNLGDLARAERLYGKLAISTTGEDQASAYLAAGRLAFQRGDTRTAADSLSRAIQAAPDSYFSARAQDILDGRAAFQSPANYQFQFDDAAQIAEAEAWLRQTFSLTQEGVLWQLAPTLESDPRLIRGRELWAVAAYTQAEAEFDDLLESFKNDGLASYQLAVFLRSLGAYRPSIVGAANVIRAAGVGTLDAPAFIAQMRYPVYYADVVVSTALDRGIDPLLLFSLIRHESLFDTYATAAAGEKGLTQVIPSTGEYIAQQLEWQNYQHSDLFRPYAGIAFGAFYLHEQLNRFDQNVVAALAGYNAGPGRALNWLELSGGDPDLFMTAITIDSTRTYVQRIYSFFTIYRALYGVD